MTFQCNKNINENELSRLFVWKVYFSDFVYIFNKLKLNFGS